MEKKFTVGILVSNHFGVLNRISGLYSKRGYNIDSLAVGETEHPELSRITIVSTGDDYMKRQVVCQLEKLHDVKLVQLFDDDNTVSVEHMLIKLNVDGVNKAESSNLINSYGGKVMDYGEDFVTAEITGSSETIDAFITQARQTGILEMCRSGAIAMIHGTENMLSLSKK